MGLFSTSNNDPVVEKNRRASGQSSRRHNDDSHQPVHYGEEPRRNPVVGGHSYQKAPKFGQWIKGAAIDILTLATFGALALGLYFVRPTNTRDFPVTFQDGEVVQPSFAYPIRRHIIPIWAAALISVLVPMFVVLMMQIRIKSFWDTNNAFFGILYSVVSAAVIQTLLKWLIGGIAPNFLEVCQPVFSPEQLGIPNVGRGWKQIYYNSSICTGNPYLIARALESFPCGKTTAVFAGLVFLSLYLNAKLKVMSNYHPAMWKLIAVLAPLLGAVLIGGTNTIDRGHHWYDCLAGALIGTLTAFISYRMVYAAIWDFRFNHIPTNRTIPCAYGSLQTENTKACFTHQAAWNEGAGTFGGAPNDSKSGHSPQVVSMNRIERGEYTGDSGHGHGPVVLRGADPNDRRGQEHMGPRAVSPARNNGPTMTGANRGTPTVTVEEITPATPQNNDGARL